MYVYIRSYRFCFVFHLLSEACAEVLLEAGACPVITSRPKSSTGEYSFCCCWLLRGLDRAPKFLPIPPLRLSINDVPMIPLMSNFPRLLSNTVGLLNAQLNC